MAVGFLVRVAVPFRCRQHKAFADLAALDRRSVRHGNDESNVEAMGKRGIDGDGDVAADIGRIAATGEADIVAAFGPETTRSLIGKLFDGKRVALLVAGRSPFSRSELPAVAAFISAYESKYGRRPSSQAAQGYNAARRIDVAVRAQGGVEDRQSLLRSFRQTARGFFW